LGLVGFTVVLLLDIFSTWAFVVLELNSRAGPLAIYKADVEGYFGEDPLCTPACMFSAVNRLYCCSHREQGLFCDYGGMPGDPAGDDGCLACGAYGDINTAAWTFLILGLLGRLISLGMFWCWADGCCYAPDDGESPPLHRAHPWRFAVGLSIFDLALNGVPNLVIIYIFVDIVGLNDAPIATLSLVTTVLGVVGCILYIVTASCVKCGCCTFKCSCWKRAPYSETGPMAGPNKNVVPNFVI